MFWFFFCYLIYSDYDGIWHWDRIPAPSGNITWKLKTHKIESTLGVSNLSKAYCGFCYSSLAISWCVLLMDLSLLDNIEIQESLIVQGLIRHDGFEAVHS